MPDMKITDFDPITPTDNDSFPVVDNETDSTKRTIWSTIKSTLKAYFDTLYPSGSGTSTGTNTGDQDLSALAEKANVLELDNVTPFTPDADYEPATKKYVDDNAGVGGASALVSNETPGGSINSSNTSFTLADEPVTGSLKLYLNGIRLSVTEDYTLSGSTITMVTAPVTGDILRADYETSTGSFSTGSTSFVYNETPSGLVNGSNAVFDTAHAFVLGSTQVYRDGQLMKPGGADYTETDTNTITFVTAPVAGSVILISYQSDVSAAGNADTLDGVHSDELMAGWYTPTGTFTYSSVDDPTGVITTSSNLISLISVGMRIKFTNGGNTVYGLVTAISSTTITFLHEIDPTDSQALYLMANSAITAFRYSPFKCPVGFPADARKWTVEVVNTSSLVQATPVQNTWYNLGSLSITIPIGVWRVNYQVAGNADIGTPGAVNQYVSLSTAADSVSDANFTTFHVMPTDTPAGNYNNYAVLYRENLLVLAAKSVRYLISRTAFASLTNIKFRGDLSPTIIRATCTYL